MTSGRLRRIWCDVSVGACSGRAIRLCLSYLCRRSDLHLVRRSRTAGVGPSVTQIMVPGAFWRLEQCCLVRDHQRPAMDEVGMMKILALAGVARTAVKHMPSGAALAAALLLAAASDGNAQSTTTPSLSGTLTASDLVCGASSGPTTIQDCANNPASGAGAPLINVPGDLAFTGTGTWAIATPSASQLLIIKTGGINGPFAWRVGSNALGNSIENDIPLTMSPTKTLSGSISGPFAGQPGRMYQPTYSGTITGNQQIYVDLINATSTLSGQNSFTALGVRTTASGSMSGNTYTVDCQANTDSSYAPPTASFEIHCARYQTNITVKAGADSKAGSEQGFGIGTKSSVTASSGAQFWSLLMAQEVVVDNSCDGCKDVFGVSIAKNSSAVGSNSDAGLAFCNGCGGATSGTNGQWKTLIDLAPVSYTHLDVYKRQLQA